MGLQAREMAKKLKTCAVLAWASQFKSTYKASMLMCTCNLSAVKGRERKTLLPP